MSDFYIHRKLHCGDQTILDRDVLEKNGVLVVLAEPGAGKTELLNYFSRAYKTPRQTASIFMYAPTSTKSLLIIDALDEVARINEEKINEIIVKAYNSGSSKVILASRSYVWDEVRNKFIQDCFGVTPSILRLEPFDKDEQRQLFLRHLPNEDFESFCAEVERFELSPLLGNPQFIRLLADAYVQSNRRFTSKRQIYTDSMRRLASESDQTAGLRNRPQIEKIIASAGEAFAKLLLCGGVGVSATEDIGDEDYPYVHSLGADKDVFTFALNTRLFKPTQFVNKHEPVHRIVAEYCAADYLVRHIENPTNTLSIKRCLSIIAPNGVVRSELRGLLGWLASLGGPLIQETTLDIDPYAVFANGDPSQLYPNSKKRLLNNLKSLANIDPYFRHMDSWRRFSVAGFFSDDIIEHVRPLLSPAYAGSHLRGLLLELLHGSEASVGLQQEMRAILHDTDAETTERQQAYKNLAILSGDYEINDFDVLVKQALPTSLKLASEMVSNRGSSFFGIERIQKLLEVLANLYSEDYRRVHEYESRYFIQRSLITLELGDVTCLLNKITSSISCTCKKKKIYQCTCRRGISKIVGHLLDGYFENMVGPHDPNQIARWIKPLVFRSRINPQRSTSVQTLHSNNGLRRAIHINALEGISSQQELLDVWIGFGMSYSHSGLNPQTDDRRALVDHAISINNQQLWAFFIQTHSPYAEPKGVDHLRKDMRKQARQSPELLKIWARVERNNRKQLREYRNRYGGRSNKYYEKKQIEIKNKNFQNLQENRALIEAGEHWQWLRIFAQQYIYKPDKIEDIVDDPKTLEKALLNCFDFLSPHIPSLETLSKREGTDIALVLQAACLATFRKKHSLEDVPLNVLQAVKAEGINGSGYKEGEDEKLGLEIDRLLFTTDEDLIEFINKYIEPQLTQPEDSHTQVYILNNNTTFNTVKGEVALDWLERYPNMPCSARETLFGIAAEHADRTMLNSLIVARCSDLTGTSEIEQKRRKFWLLRHFFFIVPTSGALWKEFSTDTNSIFSIESYAGRWARHDSVDWPQLNAEKLYLVLNAFVLSWPKVNLPSSWGTGDPDNERAYRFLSDIVYQIGKDNPSNSITIFNKILSDSRFSSFHDVIKSQKANAIRQNAHMDFEPPRLAEISNLLDESKIASVEDMRVVLIELLDEIQESLKGAATNPVDVFYSGDKKVDENTARNRIVEMFQPRLNALHLGVVVEHQMLDAKRCDFTASTSINGSQTVLVTEVKGQWHRELYTAASTQLSERYTIYPGAADQGVYLVLWFGGDEIIAGKKDAAITSASQLRQKIIEELPKNLIGRIDVYVLDVSK